MRILASALALTLLASGAAQASTTNLLTNGSFEDYTGSLNSSGWNIFSSANVPGWTGVPNIELQSEPTLNPDLPAQDGLIYAELDTNTNSTLFQSLTLDTGVYEFSFWYSPRVNGSPADTNDMSFAVDGLGISEFGTILDTPNPTYPFREWTQVVLSFLVASDNTNVTFTFTALGTSSGDPCGNCGALIDNVSVSPVPVPAGAVLLLGALAGLGIAGRRRVAA